MLPPFPSSPRPRRAYQFFVVVVEITAGASAEERVYGS